MREICFENCLSLSRFDQRWCVDILHLKWKSNISLRVFSHFQDNSFDAYTFIKCVKKVVSICITRSSTVLKTFTHPNDSFFVFSVFFHLKSEPKNESRWKLMLKNRTCVLALIPEWYASTSAVASSTCSSLLSYFSFFFNYIDPLFFLSLFFFFRYNLSDSKSHNILLVCKLIPLRQLFYDKGFSKQYFDVTF